MDTGLAYMGRLGEHEWVESNGLFPFCMTLWYIKQWECHELKLEIPQLSYRVTQLSSMVLPDQVKSTISKSRRHQEHSPAIMMLELWARVQKTSNCKHLKPCVLGRWSNKLPSWNAHCHGSQSSANSIDIFILNDWKQWMQQRFWSPATFRL